MESIYGIFYFNMGFFIGSLVVVVIGAAILANSKSSTVKTVIGGIIFVVGALAVLSSFYFVDFRWINAIAGGLLVLTMGIQISRTPGLVSTVIGVVVIVLSIYYLSNTYPLNQLELSGYLKGVFDTGSERLMDILNLDGSPPNDSTTP